MMMTNGFLNYIDMQRLSNELPRYGLEVGLTNYAAAYCTGLFLARRVLKQLEMDDEYVDNEKATGEDYSVEPGESRKPFRALLNVGLVKTTTGKRVFDALEMGCLIFFTQHCREGLRIPNSEADSLWQRVITKSYCAGNIKLGDATNMESFKSDTDEVAAHSRVTRQMDLSTLTSCTQVQICKYIGSYADRQKEELIDIVNSSSSHAEDMPGKLPFDIDMSILVPN